VAKGRLVLIHWNAAEAEQLAAPLRKDGWDVAVEAQDGARAGKAILADPPDAVVVYLTRLPSHGRATMEGLRSYKAGRGIPLLAVGGEGEALEKTKKKVRDAQYVKEEGLKRALAKYATP
jgi:DNA-binding response OmpR family regulator